MRIFCLLFFLFVSTAFLSAQNYYVAVVKGKIFYEDKQLKKRDKIKMKGLLRFTAKSDFLKVSGPGGLYTLTPGMDEESGNEFFVAVKEEFFPKIRPHATSQQGMVLAMRDNYYFNQRGYSMTFLNRTYLLTPVPELEPGEEIGFLHETDKGIFYKTAQLEGRSLQIYEKEFSMPGKETLQKTAIVKVKDKPRWMELINGKDSIAQIEGLVDRYSWEPVPESAPILIFDPETGEETVIEEVPNPAEILDFMGPPQFVNRRKMVKDLRFHLRQCKAEDIEMFMKYYEYEDYIYETYGALRDYPDLEDVLRNDLKLTSRYDGSAQPDIIIPID